MAAADAVGKKSLFRRGINATRLALAAAVTVLIVMIVVYAIVVVSRTEQLAISVVGGVIYVQPNQLTPKIVELTFSVQANNPSGRVRFYYTDIRGLISLKNGTTYNVKLASFKLGKPRPEMDVSPVSMLQTDADLDAQYYPAIDPYFKELSNASSSNSSIFSGVKLQLNGSLTVGLYSVHNITKKDRTIYYCWPLTIRAVNASADTADDNIQCSTNDLTTK